MKLVTQGLPATAAVSVRGEYTGGFPSEPQQGQGGVPEGIMPYPWPQHGQFQQGFGISEVFLVILVLLWYF